MKSFKQLWGLWLLVLAFGCVDDANTIATNQPFPATYLRGALGCQRTEGDFVGAAQLFLGCTETPPAGTIVGTETGSVTDPPAAIGAEPVVSIPGMPAASPSAPGSTGGGAAPPVAGAGGAGPAPAGSVACGARTCPAPAGGQACCLDQGNGTCGMLTGAMCSASGMPAPSAPCPVVDLTRLGYGMLMPCCTAGQCGANTQRFPGGMPCTSLTDAKQTAESMGYRDIVPAPRACPAP